MEFNDIIQQRRSIRAYTDQPVAPQLLNDLLAQALESASSSNSQPFQVAIAQGPVAQQIGEELTDKYWRSNAIQRQPLLFKLFNALTSDAMPDSDYKPILGKYPGEFQARRVATGVGLYELLGIARHDKAAREQHMARNFHFFNAPVALFFFVDPRMKHTALVDLGIFMQAIMLGATNAGLGSCAMGALGIWRKPLDNHFDIPATYKLVCGMALGYPTDDKVNHYRPEKLQLDQLVIKPK